MLFKYYKSFRRSKKLNRLSKELYFIEESLKQFPDGDDVKTRQYIEKKLKELLIHAGKSCKYYQTTFKQFNINPDAFSSLSRIPVLTKEIIKENYRDLIDTVDDEPNYYKQNTGGSTGSPLEFEVSSRVAEIERAHQIYLWNYLGYQDKDVIVSFGGITIPDEFLAKNIYRVQTDEESLPNGRFTFSSIYLTPGNIQFYIKDLMQLKPAFFRGYPSVIYELAKYVLDNNLQESFKVKGIYYTSELALPGQVEIISKAFRCKVIGQYGQSEACTFAVTFGNNTEEYIFSPYYGYTEILNDKGIHVIPGEEGDIVATSFHNYRMPFIRYKTGDRAIFKERKNGCLIISKLLGRTQDYVFKKNMEQVAITAIIFGQHYKSFKNINKWQLVQNVPGQVLFRIVRNELFNDDNEQEIRNKFLELSGIETAFEYVNDIPLSNRGKQIFVVQNIKQH